MSKGSAWKWDFEFYAGCIPNHWHFTDLILKALATDGTAPLQRYAVYRRAPLFPEALVHQFSHESLLALESFGPSSCSWLEQASHLGGKGIAS